MGNTKESLLKAEKVFFEYIGIEKYPAHRVILDSLDVVQMIALGIEQALAEPSDESAALPLHDVNGSAFVIMSQKKPLKNILFQSDKEARNYIKMQNPKRTFKEPKENVFVCSRYGTTFEIVELHYR